MITGFRIWKIYTHLSYYFLEADTRSESVKNSQSVLLFVWWLEATGKYSALAVFFIRSNFLFFCFWKAQMFSLPKYFYMLLLDCGLQFNKLMILFFRSLLQLMAFCISVVSQIACKCVSVISSCTQIYPIVLTLCEGYYEFMLHFFHYFGSYTWNRGLWTVRSQKWRAVYALLLGPSLGQEQECQAGCILKGFDIN